jgi:hypothetical protein
VSTTPEFRQWRESNPQPELHFRDETRYLTVLKFQPCPLCRMLPLLWRRSNPGTGITFCVKCSHKDCANWHTEFPVGGAKSSQLAIQVWSVYCAMLKNES